MSIERKMMDILKEMQHHMNEAILLLKEIRDELQEFMKELPEDVMEEYIGQQNLERSFDV